jgi:hypothetical protein
MAKNEDIVNLLIFNFVLLTKVQLIIHAHIVATLFHPNVEQVLCFVHFVMHLASIGGMIAGVSKLIN